MKVLLLDPSISRRLQLPIRMGGDTFSDLFEVFLECGDLYPLSLPSAKSSKR